MSIQTDAKGREALARVVGKRLRASRRSAGVSQDQAARKLNHKGITQISLAEDGKRLPTLLDMIKYADLYSVPLDFLLGRIDDPIAEAEEQGQALVVRAVSQSIGDLFGKFANAVAAHVSVSVQHRRHDRHDLLDAVHAAADTEKSFARLKELNPDFDDLRGGAKLEADLRKLASIGKRAATRVHQERVQMDLIDRALDLQSIDVEIRQFQLAFKVSEEGASCAA